MTKSGFFTPKTIKDLSRKLMHNWHGPYCLVHKLTPVTFELRTQTNKLLKAPVHVNRVKPLSEPGLPPVIRMFLSSSTFRKMKSLMTGLHPQNYQHPLPVLPLSIKHSTLLPVLPPHPPPIMMIQFMTLNIL